MTTSEDCSGIFAAEALSDTAVVATDICMLKTGAWASCYSSPDD